jgi:hypothetical protein
MPVYGISLENIKIIKSLAAPYSVRTLKICPILTWPSFRVLNPVFFSHQWQRCHDSKYFGQLIEIFMKKQKIHILGIDTNPDRHALNADADPDPQHLFNRRLK